DVLAAHVDRIVDDALDHAGVVAQVDEGEVLAVLPAPGDPAADVDGPADVLGAQLAAEAGAHLGRAHGHVRIASRWMRRSVRATMVWASPASWPAWWRRIRTTAVPAVRSSSPMITATAAPLRSAAFICAFIERLS